jgi:periplasmic divalent cation tolerance protein
MSYVVVFVTASSEAEAAKIGRAVVDERLAACANVLGGVASRYWWKGQIEDASEALLILKTRQELVESVTVRVRALHSYTVPEVIAIPVVGGNPDYLQWIDESTRSPQSSQSNPAGTGD